MVQLAEALTYSGFVEPVLSIFHLTENHRLPPEISQRVEHIASQLL